MATGSGAFNIRSAVLYAEIYEYGGAGIDVANNRSLHRVNIWATSTGTTAYWLDAHYGKGATVSGPTGTVWTSEDNFVYDFRSGYGSVAWLYAFDVWIPHNVTGGGSAGLSAWASDDFIGYAGASVSAAMTQLFTVPAKPTAPGITDLGSTSFKYSATPGSNGGSPVTTRQVQRDTNNAFPSPTTLTPPSLLDVLVSGLAPFTTYYVRSREENALGAGPWSDVVSGTTIDVPSAPDVTIDDVTAHTITVTCEDPDFGSPFTDYNIAWSYSPDFIGGGAGYGLLTRMFSGFDQHTLVYVRARVQNAAGWGPWSAAVPVLTEGAPLSLWINDGVDNQRAAIWYNHPDDGWRTGWLWTKDLANAWRRGK